MQVDFFAGGFAEVLAVGNGDRPQKDELGPTVLCRLGSRRGLVCELTFAGDETFLRMAANGARLAGRARGSQTFRPSPAR